MKISDIQIGSIMKDGIYEVEVTEVTETSFSVIYPSGVVMTYRQTDLDNGTIETFIG